MLHPFLQEKLPEITKMFRQYHVKSAYAFGSVVTDKFNDKSDVDFIINIDESLDPLDRGEMFLNLYEKLADLLKRDVDLVSEKFLTNQCFKEELDEKKNSYMDRQTEKLLRDILEATNSVFSFTEGMSLSDYQKNKMARRAVERELTIIGEAMNNL